ncbi:MAG: hypothetical protein F4139_05875 [Gemmatimonadetes bacterium]|nr:hypothetical protein [Gemmatimonadota bacterium]MYB97298.1 hypothetical protein [Gemmatimonadota bacterium]MYH52462.1 hypothetical protein [Gemmatimonadota bacterium]MYI45031.1 hypothetical protein [Gemmatimonadota bacterium]MYK67221.1 hypothetical protein [Gemmatimonadota bacterium]
MPRIHLVVSEPDRTRYTAAARREGLTLSAWLRAAATDRLDRRAGAEPFRNEDDVWRFFEDRDAEAGCGPEPNWDQHLAVMRASRGRGAAGT